MNILIMRVTASGPAFILALAPQLCCILCMTHLALFSAWHSRPNRNVIAQASVQNAKYSSIVPQHVLYFLRKWEVEACYPQPSIEGLPFSTHGAQSVIHLLRKQAPVLLHDWLTL